MTAETMTISKIEETREKLLARLDGSDEALRRISDAIPPRPSERAEPFVLEDLEGLSRKQLRRIIRRLVDLLQPRFWFIREVRRAYHGELCGVRQQLKTTLEALWAWDSITGEAPHHHAATLLAVAEVALQEMDDSCRNGDQLAAAFYAQFACNACTNALGHMRSILERTVRSVAA